MVKLKLPKFGDVLWANSESEGQALHIPPNSSISWLVIHVYLYFPFRRLTKFGLTHDQRWCPPQHPPEKKPHLEHSNVQESSFQPRSVTGTFITAWTFQGNLKDYINIHVPQSSQSPVWQIFTSSFIADFHEYSWVRSSMLLVNFDHVRSSIINFHLRKTTFSAG